VTNVIKENKENHALVVFRVLKAKAREWHKMSKRLRSHKIHV